MLELLNSRDVIGGLAALILLAAFMIVSSNRMHTIVNAYTAQSLALGLVAAAVAYFTDSAHIYVVAALTIIIKVLIIPRMLTYIMDTIKVDREVETLLSIPASLLISGLLAIVAYYITEPMILHGPAMTRNCLAISLAVVLIGFLVMISRRKTLTQITGLLVMENGLFLAAISLTYGMPMIVEIGVFFDILVGALIMGIFAFRVNRTFETIDTGILRRLRD